MSITARLCFDREPKLGERLVSLFFKKSQSAKLGYQKRHLLCDVHLFFSRLLENLSFETTLPAVQSAMVIGAYKERIESLSVVTN